MADIPRLRKVLEHIKSLPSWRGPEGKLSEEAISFIHQSQVNLWNQGAWMSGNACGSHSITGSGLVTEKGINCGTAACFAGWAVILFGAEGLRIPSSGGEFVVFPDGRKVFLPKYARELLGLSAIQAGQLFAAANKLADLEAMVDAYEGQEEAWQCR